MTRALLSKTTRNEFREVLVGYTLREIEMAFDAGGLTPRADHQPTVGGQRRGLVEAYYANLDFSSPSDVKSLLAVYEEVIELLHKAQDRVINPESVDGTIGGLLRRMERDGFRYEGGHFVSDALTFAVVHAPSLVQLTEASIQEHLEKASQKIAGGDPAGAIANAYTLVEEFLKQLLRKTGTSFNENEGDIRALYRLLGEHAVTHIIPRMKAVVDGTDASGITKAVDWKGGGGFRYYRLAPSLLERDSWDNWVISKEYDAPKVAQAVCKLMGFVYQPDETHYWMQGRSSETDFIYVTTQSLTHEQLAAIAEEVGDERTLLVCCKAFRADPEAFPNLTIRKIPQAVLRKCEWGKDDYSLNVANLPEVRREPDEPDNPRVATKAGRKKGGKAAPQDDLFSGEAAK